MVVVVLVVVLVLLHQLPVEMVVVQAHLHQQMLMETMELTN